MVLVKQVVTPTLIVVSVDDGPDVAITDKERTNLLPEVFVFAGVGWDGVGSRLAFEADRSIGIHRMRQRNGTGSK
jgi:hypothetical protein